MDDYECTYNINLDDDEDDDEDDEKSMESDYTTTPVNRKINTPGIRRS